MSRVRVLGSINMDVVVAVARCPRPGETLLGRDAAWLAGGKGANQALAARRLGAVVTMTGAVGRDAAAGIALAPLEAAGVDLSGVARVDRPTGLATIAVGDDGENIIVVAPGANAAVGVEAVDAMALAAGDVLVLQMEVPAATVAAALARARAVGARSILNIAPATALAHAVLALADVIVVNETEAATLVPADAPGRMAQAIHARTGGAVIVTAGAAGASLASSGGLTTAPAPGVDVVDTTGAGDAFVGALAAETAAGAETASALPVAVTAASLACTRLGAQSALPTRADIVRFLKGSS